IAPRWDRATALARMGGDEQLLSEVAALFLDDYPKLLRALQEGVACGDVRVVERTAHTLKGSVSNFGAEEVCRAALYLETLGRTGDLAPAAEALGQLESALEALNPDLVALAGRA
ncbi:MAG: Hpt domain-containing protein, partial [Bryobacteraceae bacterium]